MEAGKIATLIFAGLLVVSGTTVDFSSRKLLQSTPTTLGTPSVITVSGANPIVNAITITLARPYPQNAYYCNVTGDSGIPKEGVFPLTVRTPVGSTVTVVFANITGPIPGTQCTGSGSSVVQQPGGTSIVQQPGGGTSSVIQQPNSVVQQSGASSVVQQATPSSVVQQQAGGAVVQQQYATSINQQNPSASGYLNCVASSSSVVQQGSPSSVVQQSPPSSVVQQSTPSSVVQQSTPSSVVQQSTPSSVVQQSPPSSVVQQSTPSSVVQQSTPSTPRSPPSSVVQQSTPSTPSSISSIVQQASGAVQQSTSGVVQQGRHLLQVGTIEYISNNGSTGQPQLSVLDTVEGVPNIAFKPTAVGQTASFTGALQVAVTTTNDGFGTPYLPYRVDSKLSPQCGVQVNFIAI